VESFQEDMVQARVITEKRITKLRDLVSGQELSGTPQGDTTVFDLRLSRGSYRAFSAE
jgi:hypothetical protein